MHFPIQLEYVRVYFVLFAALPFLPGFTVVDPTKQNFAKSHAFDMRKGVSFNSAPCVV